MPDLDPTLGICPTCQDAKPIRRSYVDRTFEMGDDDDPVNEGGQWVMADHDVMQIGPPCKGIGQSPETLIR